MTAALKAPRIRSKYGAKKTLYNGRRYDSLAEARRAMELDVLVKCRKLAGWVPQVPFAIEVNGVRICNYIVDFEVWPISGHKWLEEVKGHETPAYKLKMKLFKALYPRTGHTGDSRMSDATGTSEVQNV